MVLPYVKNLISYKKLMEKGRRFIRNLYKLMQPPGATRYVDFQKPGFPRVLKEFIDEHSSILTIGSGKINYGENVVHLDIVNFQDVEVIGDGHFLPFKAESFQKVIIQEVLEHVNNPSQVIREIHRVLKPGGVVFCDVPFIFPYHPNPHDYRRYSLEGLVKQFEDYQFIVEKKGVDVGPSSVLSLILRYYLSLLTSFNRKILFGIGWIFWGYLTFWIKYLDLAVAKWKNGKAEYFPQGVYVIAKK